MYLDVGRGSKGCHLSAILWMDCLGKNSPLESGADHGTVKTLGSRRRPWDERAQFFDSVVIFPTVKMEIDFSVPVRVRVSNFVQRKDWYESTNPVALRRHFRFLKTACESRVEPGKRQVSRCIGNQTSCRMRTAVSNDVS